MSLALKGTGFSLYVGMSLALKGTGFSPYVWNPIKHAALAAEGCNDWMV